MRKQLNYNWEFIPQFEESYLSTFPKEAIIVNIPHNVEDLPYNYFNEKIYQKISTYRKEFTLENYKNQIVILRFEAFMVKAKIYLNKEYLGEYVSSYSPVEIDISKYAKEENELIVVLDSHENDEVPPFGYAVDYLTFGGIYREVSVSINPKVYIQKLLVSGDSKGNVNIKPLIENNNEEYDIEYQVLYNEKVIKESKTSEFSLENPLLWDISSPNLYTLVATLSSKYGTSTYKTRFGFRDVIFTNKGFYLNGKKIKLVGLNRHQSYPYVGYAMPKSIQEDDANILKYEAGVNIVRTSHYMQSEHFLNRCDEIGLLVINEIPGWQHISKKEVWRNKHYQNVEQMVIEEYNHPSLVGHGVRIDESQDDHELYLKSNEIVHSLDSTRQTLGVRNFKNSELLEDIYAYNDFVCSDMTKGLDNPKKIKTKNHPYLVSEYLGHMEPTKATDSSKQRIYHALRHALVINDNFKYDNICGAIGWCFVDYYTHNDFGSGDHICPHGVFDMYRNKKYAASIYQSQQDEIPVLEVLSNMKPGDFPESSLMDVYIATNADYVELYKNDEYVTKLYPNTKQFKHLPHPLILVDDIIGETFKDSRFSLKDGKKIGKLLSYVAFHGFSKLSLKQKLSLGKMIIKYRLSYSSLVDLYNTHVAAWGGKAKTYTFKAYKDGKVVKEQTLGPSTTYSLKVTCSKQELINEDTYDVTRVTLQYVDEFDNVLNYANMPFLLETEGEIEIIGPKIVSLLGGQLSVYIKSKSKPGNGKLTIKNETINETIDFIVK